MSNSLSEIGKGSECYSTVFHLIMKYGEKSLISPGIIEDIAQTVLHSDIE